MPFSGKLPTTFYSMDSKGARGRFLSHVTKYETSDTACKSLKPLLAILFVGHSYFINSLSISNLNGFFFAK